MDLIHGRVKPDNHTLPFHTSRGMSNMIRHHVKQGHFSLSPPNLTSGDPAVGSFYFVLSQTGVTVHGCTGYTCGAGGTCQAAPEASYGSCGDGHTTVDLEEHFPQPTSGMAMVKMCKGASRCACQEEWFLRLPIGCGIHAVARTHD